MQITKLIADGVEKTIQGLHIFPVGMKVVLEGGEYEVVDVEFMYAKRMATVVVYLSSALKVTNYTFRNFFEEQVGQPMLEETH